MCVCVRVVCETQREEGTLLHTTIEASEVLKDKGDTTYQYGGFGSRKGQGEGPYPARSSPPRQSWTVYALELVCFEPRQDLTETPAMGSSVCKTSCTCFSMPSAFFGNIRTKILPDKLGCLRYSLTVATKGTSISTNCSFKDVYWLRRLMSFERMSEPWKQETMTRSDMHAMKVVSANR